MNKIDTATILGVLDPRMRDRLFSADSHKALTNAAARLGGTLAWFDSVESYVQQLHAGIIFPQVQILITTWGMPRLTGSVLEAFPRLSLVCHTGASVEFLLSEEADSRKILISQAGDAMARPVAEVSLAFTLAMLHNVHRFDHGMREPDGASWRDQHEILDSKIGVIGASRTGRCYIRLVQALGAKVSLYDPTVDEDEASELQVTLMSLPLLMSSNQIIAVHAPSLPETHHMVDSKMLSLMQPGAALVNTARSWLVDEEALVERLRTGLIDAAVDVFDQEPLPEGHPFCTLPNVLLTPHRAAGTAEGRRRAGEIVCDEIRRFSESEPLQHIPTVSQRRTKG